MGPAAMGHGVPRRRREGGGGPVEGGAQHHMSTGRWGAPPGGAVVRKWMQPSHLLHDGPRGPRAVVAISCMMAREGPPLGNHAEQREFGCCALRII